MVCNLSTWRGADKSPAWPGRKQATVTKLGIYSTYSPQGPIHFLAHCSNFCKPLKKKIQNVVHPTRSPWQQWPLCWTKNGDLSLICFSVQGTGDHLMGPDTENRVGDKDIGSPVRPVSSGLQVLGALCTFTTMTKNWGTKSTHYEDGNTIHYKYHLNFLNFLFTHMQIVSAYN
jgi:hypothetical protein